MKLQKNWLEWTVFGLSALIVGATFGVLGWQSLRTGEAPPQVSVFAGPPSPVPAGWLVPVRAINRGEETVEGARIEVTLERGGTVVERAGFTVAFLPRRSERRGWVQFVKDPRCCSVVSRAVGFEKP